MKHIWCKSYYAIVTSKPWKYCRVCGVVQRADGKNKPCTGKSRLRSLEKPLKI